MINPGRQDKTNPEAERTPLINQWAPTLKTNGKSKYMGVVKAIEEGIEQGQLTPGMRLPPQREIARYFQVTIATVTRAISLAASRGLVIARPGSGTFIASASPAPAATAGTVGNDIGTNTIVRDLSLNAPPVTVVEDILQENLEDLAKDGSLMPSAFDHDP
ncbi:MAG TPA: winged helix-turn-helix domain-containing protein, partial [Burkholderiaceae bacterium]|nr:winged helix-turn-helix domain-containing protein [Burkholderiaceae bacterium]